MPRSFPRGPLAPADPSTIPAQPRGCFCWPFPPQAQGNCLEQRPGRVGAWQEERVTCCSGCRCLGGSWAPEHMNALQDMRVGHSSTFQVLMHSLPWHHPPELTDRVWGLCHPRTQAGKPDCWHNYQNRLLPTSRGGGEEHPPVSARALPPHHCHSTWGSTTPKQIIPPMSNSFLWLLSLPQV